MNKGEKQHTVTNSHKESKNGRHSKKQKTKQKKTECNQEISVGREQKTNQGKTITMRNNVVKSEGSFTVLHMQDKKTNKQKSSLTGHAMHTMSNTSQSDILKGS